MIGCSFSRVRACFGPWRIGFYCLPCHQASFCPALVHTASLGLLLHRRCLAFSPRPWPSPCAPMFSRTSVRPLDPAECAELGHCCRVGEAKNPGLTDGGRVQSETSLQLPLGRSCPVRYQPWPSVLMVITCSSLSDQERSFVYMLVGAQRARITLKGILDPAAVGSSRAYGASRA